MLSKLIVGVGVCVQLSSSSVAPRTCGTLQTNTEDSARPATSDSEDDIDLRSILSTKTSADENDVDTEKDPREYDALYEKLLAADLKDEEYKALYDQLGFFKGAEKEGADGLLSKTPPAWKIDQTRKKKGIFRIMHKVKQTLAIACKVLANTVAVPLLAGALRLNIGRPNSTKVPKIVSDQLFLKAFSSFLSANGIRPHVTFKPIPGNVRESLAEMYDDVDAGSIRDDDPWLTPVIVPNHVSLIDPAVTAMVFKIPKFVAKAEVKKQFEKTMFGKFFTELGVIYVDRANPDSKRATAGAIKKHADDWEMGHRPLTLFPEGTVTNGKGLIQFKRGAFWPGKPVRPVLIVLRSSETAAPELTQELRKLTDKAWAVRVLGRFVNKMSIIVLPPYIPSEAEIGDADLYARNVHNMMAVEYREALAELAPTAL